MAANEQKRTEINSLGEFGLIEKLTKDFTDKHADTLKSIGDDAAIIDTGDTCRVISTDLLLEGIHFDLMYTPLKHLGYKAVAVNVSDIYAMNATPKQITFSIGISNRFSVEALEELYEGVKAACKYYNVDLIGGDTTSSLQGLVLSVTAIGEANKEDIVYRNGAKEGDLICVSGNLGAAYIGLQLLEREKRIYKENPEIQPDLGNQSYVVGRQLKPEARKDIFESLAQKSVKPTAMIDVSDGVSSDIMHICTQSKVGCHLYEADLQIEEQTYHQALEFNVDPTTCALNGGEDYELLFTADKTDEALIEQMEDVHIIGYIKAADYGYMLETKSGNMHELVAQGWNHLKKD